MNLETYNLEIKDILLDLEESNDSKTVYYKNSTRSQKKLYKVKIYIDGLDLPYIKQVTYKLHSTFGKNRVNIIKRTPSNLKCGLTIWTWGIFTVNAEIEDLKGRIIQLEHRLTFGNQLQNDEVKIRNIIHKKM